MATLELPIVDGILDADQASGTVVVNGSNLNCNGTAGYIGWIFGGAGAAALIGATINSFIVQFNFPSGSFDDPNVTFKGYWSYSAVDYWTTTTNEISDFYNAGTTAAVTWNVSGVGTGAENSPELKTIFQELQGGGWNWGVNSGGAYSFRLMCKGNSGTAMRVTAYDGTPANAAKAVFDYTPAGGSLVIPRRLPTYIRL